MKRSKKKIPIIITIVAILLIIFLAASYIYRTFNLTIKEGVKLGLTPELINIELSYGESQKIGIISEMDNYWLCEASCSHSFKDLSGKEIFYEEFVVKNHKKLSYEAIIEADIKGYGQKIYQYAIQCANIRTNACPSGQHTYRRKSTIIADYHPNEGQMRIIDDSKKTFSSMAEELAHAELNILNISSIVNNLEVNFRNRHLVDEYWDSYKALKDESKEITKHWKDNEFEEAYKDIADISPKISGLYADSSGYFNDVIRTVDMHNALITAQKEIAGRASLLMEYEKYFPYNDARYAEFRQDVTTVLRLINRNTVMINDMKNYSLSLFEQEYNDRLIRNIDGRFLNISEAAGDQYLDLFIAERLTCNNCSDGIYLKNNFSGIDSARDKCVLGKSIIPAFERRRAENLERRNNANFSLDDADAQEIRELIKILGIARNISDYSKINRYLSSFSIDTGLSASDGIIDRDLRGYYSLSFQPFLNNLMELNESCNRKMLVLEMNNVTRSIQLPPIIDIAPNIIGIPPIREECCVNGNCKCCDECINYPLILLHGHSFDLENSAYSSTGIFNILEDRLVSDGYISFGTVSPFNYGDIKFDNPMVFKPTYYVDIDQGILDFRIVEDKNGDINEYAERFRSQIEYIKDITKQPKMDIISHSMGGLVIRRYIQLYGKDSINKFVMIATPNEGIDDRTAGLCRIFGEEKECNDMTIGSSLLRELDRLDDYPEVYIIAGQGCDTNGKDGDGVVQSDNAAIPEKYVKETYYINGTCTSTSLWHNSILNMQKHPEVYALLKKII